MVKEKGTRDAGNIIERERLMQKKTNIQGWEGMTLKINNLSFFLPPVIVCQPHTVAAC